MKSLVSAWNTAFDDVSHLAHEVEHKPGSISILKSLIAEILKKTKAFLYKL